MHASKPSRVHDMMNSSGGPIPVRPTAMRMGVVKGGRSASHPIPRSPSRSVTRVRTCTNETRQPGRGQEAVPRIFEANLLPGRRPAALSALRRGSPASGPAGRGRSSGTATGRIRRCGRYSPATPPRWGRTTTGPGAEAATLGTVRAILPGRFDVRPCPGGRAARTSSAWCPMNPMRYTRPSASLSWREKKRHG